MGDKGLGSVCSYNMGGSASYSLREPFGMEKLLIWE